MTDNIRSKIAAWVDSEYGSCPVAGTQLLAFIDSQQAKVAALKAERDALLKDAGRYRWLRDATPWTAISAFDKTRVTCRLASKFSEEAQDAGVDLDKAIDAAIAKAEGRTE